MKHTRFIQHALRAIGFMWLWISFGYALDDLDSVSEFQVPPSSVLKEIKEISEQSSSENQINLSEHNTQDIQEFLKGIGINVDKVSPNQLNEALHILQNQNTPDFWNNKLEELRNHQVNRGGIFQCMEKFTHCCAGYHIFCEGFWSTANGPLGIGSLLTGLNSTIMSLLASAAASGTNPSQQLVLALSCTAAVSSVISSALGALKMYAASRSTTEQRKISFDVAAAHIAYAQRVRKMRDFAMASARQHPNDQNLQNIVDAFNTLLEQAEEESKQQTAYDEVMKNQLSDVLEAQALEQDVLLNQTQTHGMVQGRGESDQPDFNNLPEWYSMCQRCMGCYDMCAFTCYQLIDGPLGLLNTCLHAGSAALLTFSLFNTGSVQENLLFSAAAMSAGGTLASAIKFFIGSRQKTLLNRIRSLYANYKKSDSGDDIQEQSGGLWKHVRGFFSGKKDDVTQEERKNELSEDEVYMDKFEENTLPV